MKQSIIAFFYKLYFVKDFDQKLISAKATSQMIFESTKGSVSHFYNEDCEQIRGFQRPKIKFNPSIFQHPLITKYSNF